MTQKDGSQALPRVIEALKETARTNLAANAKRSPAGRLMQAQGRPKITCRCPRLEIVRLKKDYVPFPATTRVFHRKNTLGTAFGPQVSKVFIGFVVHHTLQRGRCRFSTMYGWDGTAETE